MNPKDGRQVDRGLIIAVPRLRGNKGTGGFRVKKNLSGDLLPRAQSKPWAKTGQRFQRTSPLEEIG